MTGLIDSIWKNYHIPSLVFVSKEDSDGDETLVCVDGKQVRLWSSFKSAATQLQIAFDFYSQVHGWNSEPTPPLIWGIHD